MQDSLIVKSCGKQNINSFRRTNDLISYTIVKGSKKYHVGGYYKETSFDPVKERHTYNYKSRNTWLEIKARIKQLRDNNYRYFTFYNRLENDLFKFLELLKQKEYSYTEHSKITISENYWEFRGNLNHISAAFHFRIFDEDLVDKIIKQTGLKVYDWRG